MAMKINEECISCGACLPECPTNSITEGDTIYVIDAATCVECVGHHEAPRCKGLCSAVGFAPSGQAGLPCSILSDIVIIFTDN